MSSPVTPGFRAEMLTLHGDARGYVLEPVNETELAAQRNAHVVLSQPGAIRGNHFHRHATEISVVPGPALVRVRLAEGVRDFRVGAGEVWRFVFPPGVAHAMQNTGSQPQAVIAFSTEPHDRNQPDVVRDVLIAS